MTTTPSRPCRRLLLTAALALCGLAHAAEPVQLRLIGINDFHGNLESTGLSLTLADPSGGDKPVKVPVGGAAALAGLVKALRAAAPNSLMISGGDLIGAAPLVSTLFRHESTIDVMNAIGLDVSTVGNHEFDAGATELMRIARGGCGANAADAVATSCTLAPYTGTRFQYLSANVVDAAGRTLLPASVIKTVQGIRVGIIGAVTRTTPSIVIPSGVAGLRFTDEADAINAGVTSLKAQGAQAVVVLIHQGIHTGGVQDPNGCDKPTGDLQPVLARLDPRVDLIVSGHTHWAYVCEFARNGEGPLLFTSAGLYGKLVTDITLSIDPVQGRVVSSKAHNVIVQSEAYTGASGPVALTDAYPRFEPAPDVAQFIARYVAGAKASAAQVIGHLSGPATKGANAESPTGGALGHLIADAQLAATRSAGAQVALMNPFGIRAPLVPSADGQNDGAVTFGNVFQVQPFANRLTTLSLSGAELKAVLEQGLDDSGSKQWLSPSAGFAYRYDMARAPGDRIVAMALDGAATDPAKRYRVTVNNFLAQGGDGFSVFAKGADAALGMTDLQALEAWIKVVPLRTVPGEKREQPAG